MMLTAEDVMNDQWIAVRPENSIAKAVDQLLDERAELVLVTDFNERLVGVMPSAILLRAALDAHLRQDPVSLHMSRQCLTVDVWAPLETVIDQFMLHGLHYLPVVKHRQPVGVIGRLDLLRAAYGRPRQQQPMSSA